MNIRFNGEEQSIDAGMTLKDFLMQGMGLDEQVLGRSVVAINQTLLPKSEIEHYELKDSDDVELLTAVVGG